MTVTYGRIDLAHIADFKLGSLTIRPSRREIIGDDRNNEVVEPRVMQVLVMLHRANGSVVSRDDLSTPRPYPERRSAIALRLTIADRREPTPGTGRWPALRRLPKAAYPDPTTIPPFNC